MSDYEALLRDLETGSDEDVRHALQQFAAYRYQDESARWVSFSIAIDRLRREEPMLRRLIGLLGSDDEDVRTAAAGTLLQFANTGDGTPPALLAQMAHDTAFRERFLTTLRDRRVEVRAAMCWLAGGLRHKAVPPYLTEGLQDADVDVRMQSAAGLRFLGDTGAVGALIQALDDPVMVVRIRCIYALEELNDAAAAPALLRLLQGEFNAGVASAALHALRTLRYPPAVPTLMRLTREGVLGAAEALGAQGDPAAFDTLMQLLDEPEGSGHQHAAAIAGLAALKDSKAVPRLIGLVLDPTRTDTVRDHAARVLIEFEDERAVGFLSDAFERPWDIGFRVAHALSATGTPWANRSRMYLESFKPVSSW